MQGLHTGLFLKPQVSEVVKKKWRSCKLLKLTLKT